MHKSMCLKNEERLHISVKQLTCAPHQAFIFVTMSRFINCRSRRPRLLKLEFSKDVQRLKRTVWWG